MDEQDLWASVLGWPGIGTSVKWQEDLPAAAAGRMCSVMRLRGTMPGILDSRAESRRFPALTERPGFIPAPYLARVHRAQAATNAPLPVTESRDLLQRGNELVHARIPRKTRRDLAD